MMARRSGWGWIRIRTTRENTASAQDRRIRFHPKCNRIFPCRHAGVMILRAWYNDSQIEKKQKEEEHGDKSLE
jgi:hypothetical protein